MADQTSIEWADSTWNPVTGCVEVSPGCDHCYAKTFAERFRGVPGHHFENGFDLQLRPERLEQPLRWKKPRRVFVNSMSDLFHKDVPDEFIAKVFAVMALAHAHTFQVLTKRHGRMRSLLTSDFRRQVAEEMTELICSGARIDGPPIVLDQTDPNSGAIRASGNVWGPAIWPLPNVWLGVSVEDQERAGRRIPALLATPAAVRFLSCEPLLGPINLHVNDDGLDGHWLPDFGDRYDDGTGEPVCQSHGTSRCTRCTFIDWVIVGGESGRGARPMVPIWARGLRDQCTAAGIPFLFKQWGEWVGASITDPHAQIVRITGELAGHPMQNGSVRGYAMKKVGKKAAGRELDGRTWTEFPTPVVAHA